MDDLEAARDTLLAAGAVERDAVRQIGPGSRVCVVTDADGDPIGLRGVWAPTRARRSRRLALPRRPGQAVRAGVGAGSSDQRSDRVASSAAASVTAS